MFSVNLSTRECDGHVIVALRGELDITDAASVAAAVAAVAGDHCRSGRPAVHRLQRRGSAGARAQARPARRR